MIVYIWGNLTADNFTPRPGKDTTSRSGQKAGLSASDTIPPGRKAQGIDIDLLKPPLKAFADDPNQDGAQGHYAIAPADETGELPPSAGARADDDVAVNRFQKSGKWPGLALRRRRCNLKAQG